MSDAADALRAMSAWPQVAGALDEAREACTTLRWHEGLRRRVPEAAAESRIRGARASAELDGARSGDDVVRRLVIGAMPWPQRPDATTAVLQGAVRVTAEAGHVGRIVASSPRQALARLHTVAAEGLLADASTLGRPRRVGEECAEYADLGPAPADPTARLGGVLDLLAAPGGAPVTLVAALVHAEIALARPFVRGNGLVARAVERALLHAGGVDPTGVSVPEVGHTRAGSPYLGTLAAYATGRRDGVEIWLTHVCRAVVAGAREGERIADAVRAGRLDAGPRP